MNVKELFLAFIDCFEDLGKEVFSFLVLVAGLILLVKTLITGQEFTDLVKAIGVAYIGGCAVGSTSDALIKHFEAKALELKNKLT
jgi:hypothetical protein